MGIGEHKNPGGVERERETKRKVRGRDNERGAREREVRQERERLEGERREKETEGREKNKDE